MGGERTQAESGRRASRRRRNVTVGPEAVVPVVVGLDLNQAVEVLAVGRPEANVALLLGLEADVVAAGRKRTDPLPDPANPGTVRCSVSVDWFPQGCCDAEVFGVVVAHGAIVLGPLVVGAGDVGEADLPP